MKLPTLKQLLKVLNTKKHLMTDTQKESLWDYYRVLCKEGFPAQRHVDAWEAFKKSEDSETAPKSDIEQVQDSVEALNTRLDGTLVDIAEMINEINKRLDDLEK